MYGLRSGKTLPKMARPPSRTLPHPQNNVSTLGEPSDASSDSHIGTSTFVGEMHIIIGQITTSNVSPEMVVPLSRVTSVSIIPMAAQNVIGDQRPHVPLIFTLPLSDREQPYDLTTAIIASMYPNASTYVDNLMAIASPNNPYLESGFSINNPGQMAQQLRGLEYIPLGMPPLTNNSL